MGSARVPQQRRDEQAGQQQPRGAARAPSGPVAEMLALQGAIGNRALARRSLKSIATSAAFGEGDERRTITHDSNYYAAGFGHFFAAVTDISTTNGRHTLKGRKYTAKDKSQGAFVGYTVLFLSGSGGSAQDYSFNDAKYFADQGADTVTFNYRGFGDSETVDKKGKAVRVTSKDMNKDTFRSDAMAMFNWVRANEQNNPAKIIVVGYSLGGPIAADLVGELASNNVRVGGLILHSALDSVKEQAVRGQGAVLGGVGASLVSNLDTGQGLQKLAHAGATNMPLMFMSGGGQNEHLDLNTTNLHTRAAQDYGFTSVFSKQGQGDHTNTGAHFSSPGMRDELRSFAGAL